MSRAPLAAFLAFAALVVPAPAAGAAERWVAPLDRPSLARPFAFDRLRPYEPGQRRVAELAGRPRERVASPCSGVVSFAGRLPGGAGVTVACGDLLATLTGLASVEARRGPAVAAGEPVGRAPASGRVRLGARRPAGRHRYLDPMTLIGGGRPPAPLAPAARPGHGPRPTRRVPGDHRVLAGPAILLGLAWLGLGLASSAVGLGLALRRPALRARTRARAARPAGR